MNSQKYHSFKWFRFDIVSFLVLLECYFVIVIGFV